MTGSTESKDRIIKILEMTGEPLGHGGQESFIFNFISGLERHDLKIDVLTPYACENDNWKRIISGWGEIYEFGLKFEPGKSRADIKEPLKAFLMEHKYDVVHIHSGSISVLAFASKIAKKSGVKNVIVHSHSIGIESIKHKAVRALCGPDFEKYPTKLCACSKEAGYWKFPEKIAKEKLEVIINGIELSKFEYSPEKRNDIRTEYGISNEDFVIGHVGRFSYEKNHEFLLRIISELKEKTDNIKLMLVGEGNLFEEVQEKVRERDLSSNVVFVGNTDSVQDFYNAMDVFCLPSIHEAFGIVNVEALANGLDVITTDQVAEEVRKLERVISLKNDNLEGWIRNILEIKDRKKPREKNSQNLDMFDIKYMCQKLIEMYGIN